MTHSALVYTRIIKNCFSMMNRVEKEKSTAVSKSNPQFDSDQNQDNPNPDHLRFSLHPKK